MNQKIINSFLAKGFTKTPNGLLYWKDCAVGTFTETVFYAEYSELNTAKKVVTLFLNGVNSVKGNKQDFVLLLQKDGLVKEVVSLNESLKLIFSKLFSIEGMHHNNKNLKFNQFLLPYYIDKGTLFFRAFYNKVQIQEITIQNIDSFIRKLNETDRLLKNIIVNIYFKIEKEYDELEQFEKEKDGIVINGEKYYLKIIPSFTNDSLDSWDVNFFRDYKSLKIARGINLRDVNKNLTEWSLDFKCEEGLASIFRRRNVSSFRRIDGRSPLVTA